MFNCIEQTEEDKACSFVQISDSMKPDTTDQNHKIDNKMLLVVLIHHQDIGADLFMKINKFSLSSLVFCLFV